MFFSQKNSRRRQIQTGEALFNSRAFSYPFHLYIIPGIPSF